MDIVLGVSMAPTTVRLVLVEGKTPTAPQSTKTASRWSLPRTRPPLVRLSG
ncbi:hypothetical protein I553_9954 [Mycobacterium xenopi 4042]|uniref:DUF7159 domain-containing protein n=1 Tax=Mycobacterium xenopi 4042 TaxID=1299334 RepID=X7YNW8_MYCXE|nr:hypothetical protein I553_9954 [Mycobacterium xenopi 4042]